MKNSKTWLALPSFIFLFSFSAFAQESASQPTERLEPIQVRSDIDKQSGPLVTAPGSFVRQDRESIKSSNADKLEQALGQVPNVEFTGGPRLESQVPQIRGLNGDRILILEDGVRQNFQSGHNGRIFSDFSLLESVEIVKGPWSSLYGSGAMGGVMSFRRSTASDYIRRSGKEYGLELGLDSASANSALGSRVTAFGRAKWFEPLVSYRQADSKDIRLGDGEALPYSASETKDFYSSLGFRLSEQQSFTLKLNRYTDEAKVPLEPDTPSSPTNLLGESKIIKQDMVGDYQFAHGSLIDLHARPYFRQTDVRKTRVSDGREDHQIVETVGLDAWNNFRFQFGPELKSTITTGVEIFRDRDDGIRQSNPGAAEGPLSSFPDGESQQTGLYAQPSLSFRKFTLTPGVRYDAFRMRDSSGLSAENSSDHTSFKAYGSYEFLDNSTVYLGWGQAYNAPRLQDIYISGQHFPGNFFIANPDLKPETSETWEGGTKTRFQLQADQMLSASANYFRTEARDFINRAVDFGLGTTRFENLDRVRLEGFEASLAWQATYFGAGASYGQTRSLDKNSGAPLADTQADQWMANFNFYPFEGLSVGSSLRFTEKQNHVPTGTEASPSYFVEDFYLGYADNRLDARLRLNNAFDRDYQRHGSQLKDPGRDLRLSVSWLF